MLALTLSCDFTNYWVGQVRRKLVVKWRFNANKPEPLLHQSAFSLFPNCTRREGFTLPAKSSFDFRSH